jgi:hypothetical protein
LSMNSRNPALHCFPVKRIGTFPVSLPKPRTCQGRRDERMRRHAPEPSFRRLSPHGLRNAQGPACPASRPCQG